MSELPSKAVFLSYASQDAEAAKRIADALRAAGVEVWFDAEGGLEHGDEWDRKIRRQIKDCVLFIAVISANTQAREEGYFRIEWELAAQRALGIASGVAFILPIVIDDTREPAALVPDRFRTVQWTRLAGGRMSPEVLQRFLKLWSHRTGMLKPAGAGDLEAERPRPPERGEGAPAPNRSTASGRRFALTTVVVLLLGAVLYLALKPRRSPEEIAKIISDAQKLAAAVTPPAPAAPPLGLSNGVSDARHLVTKTHALFEALDTTRDDYKLAEELLAQAKSAAPNDAEVWAADAQLNSRYIQRGWDTSDARRESARVAAQRAQRLDPQSFEARFAQATLLGYTGREGTDKEKLLRDLHRESPADHRVLRELGSTIERQGRTDEGIVFMDEAAALPGGDPLALYNKSLAYWFVGRTVEAQAALRAAIAQKPFTGALLIDVWYAIVLRADLESARATLEKIPAAELQEDRGCFFAYFLHYLRRRPDEAIDQLRALPRDWLNDSWYRGPKGHLMGDALQLAGRGGAAAAEWRAALRQVDARLATDPANPSLQYNRILLLAKLGEKAEAAKHFEVLLQLRGIDLADGKAVPVWVTEICINLGRKSEAIQQIALGLQQVRRAVSYTAAILRLDPTYDPLRGEPEFAKVIAAADDLERAAVIAATPPPLEWPKDADLKRALKLLYSRDAIAEDFALAEDMVKPQLAAHPNDPDVATVAAVIAQEFLTRGFDTSEQRRSTVQRLTERAAQLAPDNPVALAALGRYLAFISSQLPRAQKLLRRAIELNPDESRYYRTLLETLRGAPSAAEAEAVIAQMAERFPRDPLVRYDIARYYKDVNNVVAMERAIDETLALEPLASAMIWKSWLALEAHGDVPGMKTWLDRVPERQRMQTRVASALATYAEVAGNAREAVKLLSDLPDTWLSDFDFTGPKALLLGNVLAIDGRRDLARLQYEAALVEIKRTEEQSPTDLRLRRAEFWALVGLGRREEALATLQILLQGTARPFRVTMNNSWWHGYVRAALLLDQRAPALELLREAADNPTSRMILRHQFDLDPRMAPLRGDPEIKALLAEPEEKSLAAAPKADDKSVAVLAFANLSDDKANEYFSDGISEELLTVLQKIPGLHVAARTSAFFFKGKSATAQEIGEKLGVATLVEGSVRKAGNSVRITARLSRAATGEQLWSESYTRDLKDVFAVQSELAETIVGQLRGQLGGTAAKAEIQAEVQAAEKGGTRNVQAHELYLQGKYFLNHATLEDTARATALLQRAVDLDPDFALAWAALSGAGWFRGGYGLDRHDFDEGFALARRAADRALAIEPRLVAGLIARFDLQSSLDFDWAGSRESLRRVQELAPNDPSVVFRAAQLAFGFGQLTRAEELDRQAAALDPVNPLVYTNQGYVLLALHRFDDAAAAFRRVQELSPASPWGHAGIATALVAAGRSDEAAAEAARETNEWSRLYALSLARWGQKDRPAADKVLAEFIAANAEVAAYQIACVYAYRGEADHAFEWLERAYRQRDPGLGWSKEDYFLQGLHADPRWPAFLKKLGVAGQQLP